MAFRFNLAAVLKYRKNLEQREYLELGKVQQEILSVEAQLEQCDERRMEAVQRREQQVAKGTVSVHLQQAYEWERNLENQRNELQVRRQELQVKRMQRLKAYEQARQKREILDHLRTEQLHAYLLEQSRREQNRIDDLFLARMKRRS